MSGDEQEGVKKAPPTRLGETAAQAVRYRRQRGYELDRELTGGMPAIIPVSPAAIEMGQ
jgi:hypothetical protein